MAPLRSVVVLAVLAVGIVGIALYLRSERDPGASGGPQEAPPVSAPPSLRPPLPALLEVPAPTRKPERLEGMIRYPDGTYMPALNGVKMRTKLDWPSGLPFSPIVGKRMSAGTEWYVHADGTQSTSVMTWRSDLGREDALCHVARPMAPLPEEKPETSPAK